MTRTNHYEDVAEAKRQALASDIAELKDRFSSDTFIGGIARQFGIDTKSFQKSVRADDESLPLAMIGAGTAMLAGRYFTDRGHDHLDDEHYYAATDVSHASVRLRQRHGESDDAFAARTYDEFGRRLDIERHKDEDDQSFMDRVDNAMHALGDRFNDGASHAKSGASSVGHSVSGAAKGTASSVSGAAKGTASTVSGAAKGAARSTGHAASSVGRTARERAAYLRDRGSALGHAAQERAARVKAKSKQQLHQLGRAHEENPAVGTSIGMAVGLLAGSLFPTTEREKRSTDGLADALLSAAQNALSQVNDRMDQAEQEQPSEPLH